MKYLNKLSDAKRMTVVEGQETYITTSGIIRSKLEENEEAFYTIKVEKGKQKVYKGSKQILPERKSTRKLPDSADGKAD